MSVNYSRNWLMGALKWVIVALIVLLLYLIRKVLSRIIRGVSRRTSGLWGFYRKHETATRKTAQSVMMPVVLTGLLVPAWILSRFLAALILFLLWVCAVYQIVLHWRRRKEAKTSIE
jgi:hypothetical protein